MAYLCVDPDGEELIYPTNPKRGFYFGAQCQEIPCWERDQEIELPKGSIAKLIGRELTWEDEPVMID